MANQSSSNELRHDWLADRWVIFAPLRGDRPDDFAEFRPPKAPHTRDCPFCAGNEKSTPASVASYPGNGELSNATGWQVRVVPNKFPAVNGVDSLLWQPFSKGMGETLGSLMSSRNPRPESDVSSTLNQPPPIGGQIDLFARRRAAGAHEVIIESPDHTQSLSELDRGNVTTVFEAYRDRLRHWAQCQDIAYAVLFKNVGYEAGASLTHSHSQLIATNILPTDVGRIVERMELFHRLQGECLFCRMLRDELAESVRIVASTAGFVAFCPFASRFPSLVTVLPRQHSCSFEMLDDSALEELGHIVQTVVRGIEATYLDTAYNFIIHTAPRPMKNSRAFHWRMEIFPRLTKIAGFEWGSDCHINPLVPESAARRLRDRLNSI